MRSAALRRRSRVVRPDVVATVVVVCGQSEVTSWPLRARGRPALTVVDDVARLQLAARRLGLSIRLRDASVEFSELLERLGLGEVVPRIGGLGIEVGGQAEHGEQVGVEEVVMPDDPVA